MNKHGSCRFFLVLSIAPFAAVIGRAIACLVTWSRLSLVGGAPHRHIDAERSAVGGLLHGASDPQSKRGERAQGEPTTHNPSPPVWSAFLSYLSSPQPRFAGWGKGNISSVSPCQAPRRTEPGTHYTSRCLVPARLNIDVLPEGWGSHPIAVAAALRAPWCEKKSLRTVWETKTYWHRHRHNPSRAHRKRDIKKSLWGHSFIVLSMFIYCTHFHFFISRFREKKLRVCGAEVEWSLQKCGGGS